MYLKVHVLGCKLNAVWGLLDCMYTYKFGPYKCVQRCFETSQICLLFQLNCWTGRLPYSLITFIAGKLTNLALPTSTELCELFTSHFENKIKIIVSQLPSNKAANTNNSVIPNLKPVTILKLQILLAFYAPTPQGAIMFCQIFGLNSYSFSGFSNPSGFSHC